MVTENHKHPSLLARIAASAIGVILILYGIVAAVSPLPFGVILIIVGFLMIAGANPAARPIIRRMREKWKWFDAIVDALGPRTSGTLHDVIEETDPPDHHHADAQENSSDQSDEKTET